LPLWITKKKYYPGSVPDREQDAYPPWKESLGKTMWTQKLRGAVPDSEVTNLTKGTNKVEERFAWYL